ncbi:hypothetical protein [Halostella litorea]|uniref:hypothetical protein n=1 Tax=Halostella litorea TaxID=2528831 RepID=UPI0010921D25|nr:hypothetical protein [Halostella litorea]
MSPGGSASGQRYILDATVLSNFAATNSLQIPDALFPSVATTRTVHQELKDGVEQYPYLRDALVWAETEWEVIEPNELARAKRAELSGHIDLGEASVLAIGAINTDPVVTDDGEARDLANAIDVEYTGSIGILLHAAEREIISLAEAERLHHKWVHEHGFRSPVESLLELADTH